jgi:hypothetical protein
VSTKGNCDGGRGGRGSTFWRAGRHWRRETEDSNEGWKGLSNPTLILNRIRRRRIQKAVRGGEGTDV